MWEGLHGGRGYVWVGGAVVRWAGLCLGGRGCVWVGRAVYVGGAIYVVEGLCVYGRGYVWVGEAVVRWAGLCLQEGLNMWEGLHGGGAMSGWEGLW